MIKIDIATKVVSPDTLIWVVFPGLRRRFLNIFLANDVVFLEAPGLELNPEVVKHAALVRQRTRLSMAVADYVRKGDGQPPARNPSNYSDAKLDDGPEKTLASNIRKMFAKMKAGDLIVVPGQTFAPVHFAEIISDFSANDTIEIDRYPGEQIPVRKVRWLSQVPRAMVPSELQVYLSKPPAAQMVPRGFQNDQFFRLAYPSFVQAEKSAVMMEGPRYDGKHPLATHEANVLVSYFISAFNAIELNRLQQFTTLDVDQAIAAFYAPALVDSFSQNFNSPGKFGLVAFSAIMATFVSAGIAVSLLGPSDAQLAGGIEVTNSISPQDSHAAKSAGVKLQYLYNALQKQEIDRLSDLADKAEKNIGLRTPMKVEVAP
ncbi:hypothetical protein SR870_02560 [Rhodopseudomonas palustris]|uniref:hypothetical protein n=1 Tax=Rhodopseudomonas palustris TaxID=1076 RepID=UPI002ACDFCAC|nr:hypothetical protein [Rhodopseudomonas palustris]WQH00195.1 hypothetical protein SR870_02560 [Rhodopseudomonas palustris]